MLFNMNPKSPVFPKAIGVENYEKVPHTKKTGCLFFAQNENLCRIDQNLF